MIQYARISVLLLAFIALPLCGCSFQGNKPLQDTAERFLGYVKASDTDAAYLLCTAECRAAIAPEEFQQTIDQLRERHGAIKSWSCSRFRVFVDKTGSSAEMTYDLRCERSRASVEITVVAEGDGWRIQTFRFPET